MQIVVIQTAYLGDVILTTPLIKELTVRYPSAKIHFVTTSAGALALNGLTNVVAHVYEKRNTAFLEGLREMRSRLLLSTRGEAFDLVYLVHRSFRSSFLAAMLPAKNRIGFNTPVNFFLKLFGVVNTVSYPKYAEHLHYSQKPLLLLGRQAESNFKSNPRPVLKLPYDHVQISQKLGEHYIVLSPFSAWGTKMWPLENFGKLACELIEQFELPVIFCGEPNNRNVLAAENLMAQLKITKPKLLINAVGQTSVSEMISIIAKAKLLVSNDSAPVHVASAFNVPTVAVFGPTVPRFGFFPLAERSAVVERLNLECRPCSLHGPEKCPKSHFRCMNEIAVEDVIKAVQNVTRGQSWFATH